MRDFAAQTGAILWKDLLLELRSRDIFTGMFVFALVVLVVFNFAFDLRLERPEAVAPGVIWVTVVFAGVLGIGRTIAVEKDRGTLEGLLLAPMDRSAIYLAKLAANALFMGLVEVVAFPFFAVLFNAPILELELIVIAALGTLGFAAVGTLFAAMAANSRARELLLPVLLFPITVPVIIAAVGATGAIMTDPLDGPPWLGLLLAFDVLFGVVGFLVFDYVLET
ncbi:MAG: heme exporter protein CcmB [Chloroflexi bacterium]|nr:heme exporter protein CcmB [Chloroflexota bacterium]